MCAGGGSGEHVVATALEGYFDLAVGLGGFAVLAVEEDVFYFDDGYVGGFGIIFGGVVFVVDGISHVSQAIVIFVILVIFIVVVVIVI